MKRIVLREEAGSTIRKLFPAVMRTNSSQRKKIHRSSVDVTELRLLCIRSHPNESKNTHLMPESRFCKGSSSF